jgi:hypothetical protein
MTTLSNLGVPTVSFFPRFMMSSTNRTSPNCRTSTRCPQFLVILRKEGGSARQNAGDESYSREGI